MQPAAPRVKLDIDVGRVHCTLVGMALAAAVVCLTYSGSVVGSSLVKKGIPETLNTFADSANSTFGRLWGADVGKLLLNPEDLGFLLGERIAILHDAVGEYYPDDARSEIKVAGTNLDRAVTISVGREIYTTEQFKYDEQAETLALWIRGDPGQIADEVTVADSAGERATRIIRWPNPAGTHQAKPLGTPPKPTVPVAVRPPSESETREAARIAELKAGVLAVLAQHKVTLSSETERAFKDEPFHGRNDALFRRLMDNVAKLGSADEASRKATLRALLETPLFREFFVNLSDGQLAALFGPSNSAARIDEILSDERGPAAAVKSLALTPVTTVAVVPDRPVKPPPLQTITLKPAEYRQIFRAEEPFRECLANQAKLLHAAEAAIAKGDAAGELNVSVLVSKGYLPATLNCPAGGRYIIDRTAALDCGCTVHGNGSQPNDEHAKFKQLFDVYEKARDLITREGGAARALAMLEGEHERQPQNPYIGYLLGRTYVDGGNFEGAHKLLLPLSDEAPRNINYSYPCGVAFYAVGNAMQAANVLERAATATFDGSREEIGSRAEFYLFQDKAAWMLRKAAGRPGVMGSEDEVIEPEEKPIRFLEFKQQNEPEYPSQVCLRGLLAMERAVGPVLEAFMQPEMRDRWAALYQKYSASHDKHELVALETFLKSLSKEYLGLLAEAPPVCPAKGFFYLEATGGKVVLQCSVHKDIEPDATASLDASTPSWQIKAVNNLLWYLLRGKNTELDRCLVAQEKIAEKALAWDDAKNEPTLANLVALGGLPRKLTFCPTGKRLRLSKEKVPSCEVHPSLKDVNAWLADWPAGGTGRQ